MIKNNFFNNLQNNQVCIYGLHPSIAAINNPERKIFKVICNSNISEKLEKLLINPEILKGKIKHVDNKYFHNLQDTTHQGIVVIASKLPTLTVNEFINKYHHLNNNTIVLLDEVTDPRNIGAIIRSCVAFGVSGILFVEHRSPSETSSMVKSAAGSFENINIVHATNLAMSIKALKDSGYWVLGLDAHTDTYLDAVSMPDKKVLILGSEGKGMRKLTKESCDFLAKIPMNFSKIESLNISNAAAIALYELQKKGIKT